jgi:hypothetical protein
MRKSRSCLTIGLSALLITASACSFTTAHISSFKLSKDKEGNSETSTFEPGDTIYARAIVSNVPSKVSLKFRLITEKVERQPENAPVTKFDTTVELPSDGVGTYTLTPPPAGWPAGRYRIEASMLIESGEQKDQKSATFTVSDK